MIKMVDILDATKSLDELLSIKMHPTTALKLAALSVLLRPYVAQFEIARDAIIASTGAQNWVDGSGGFIGGDENIEEYKTLVTDMTALQNCEAEGLNIISIIKIDDLKKSNGDLIDVSPGVLKNLLRWIDT